METAGKEEISVEDEAVDKNVFRDCTKIAFYRRQKQQQLSKNSTYRALLNSVTTGKDSTRFQIIEESAKDLKVYAVQVRVQQIRMPSVLEDFPRISI